MIALTLHGTEEETARTLLLLGTVLDIHGVYGPEASRYGGSACVVWRLTATPLDPAENHSESPVVEGNGL